MSTEKEKWNEKLTDLLRFIDLMVRQTCRRAHYEHQIRSKPIREDKNSIYSVDHLKKVYDKPREHIYQLVKNPQKTLKGQRVENSGTWQRKDSKFTKIEQKMLLDFVKKVQDQAPSKHFIWIDLQHYLFYAYRNFACSNPNPMPETLSAFFICEMKELVDCLRKEDESQVWLRIFTLLREYCIFAQWHYSQNDEEHALMKFFCYYEAMLTAAKSLVPVFSDFEKDVIYKNYRVCWIDFNTFIFIRFFYESDRVKSRINECVRTKNSPGDSQQMFTLLCDLKKLWAKEQTRISLVNQEGKLAEHSPEAGKEKKVMATHKKVLSATFWVERSKEVKKFIDLSRMDHNLFDLLKDKQFFPEGPGLNKNGQCICEECLLTKYKGFLDTNDDFSVIATQERTSYCRRCKCILKLDQFHRHINSHVEDLNPQKKDPRTTSLARIISEKMDFVKLGNNTVNLSDMLNEKLKICENGTGSNEQLNNIHLNKLRKPDINATKSAFDKYLQKKDKKDGDKNKNGRTLSLREELLANGFVNGLREENERPPTPIITAEQLDETELKLREIHRNGHKPYTNNRVIKCPGTDGTSPICSAHYDDLEPKRCDCTYCEVFGTAQKGVEPRDKLRVRLYRRRERRRENECKPGFLGADSNKVKANKVESRVPLPSSPSNIPSTPSDSSEYSITTREMPDIRGLVNYIEGNTARNKAELAQKKAAKKARQKERREQDRIEAELEAKRKIEQKARQEKERKKALERKEENKKLEEAKYKKKLKKQRQAEKRQAADIQKNTIEETIPAMVTIKRVPGGENGIPSVTITLKGCTPDQDKLLTTLVEEPKIEEKNKSNQVLSNNKSIPENKGGKKKKTPGKLQVQSKDSKQTLQQPKLLAKDVKVTFAVDKEPMPLGSNTVDFIAEKPTKRPKVVKREREPTEEEIKSLGNLRLPPGITITKVEGPVTNKTYFGSDSNKGASVMGKSGVIVVDTEKLIQKTVIEGPKLVKTNKKKKKKNKKPTESQTNGNTTDKPKMVTLRNPMFQQFQTQNLTKAPVTIDESAPAAIFTSENGMVTIRSSRLQQSMENGMGQPPSAMPVGMPLIPNMLSDMTNFCNPNHYTPEPSVNGIDKSESEEKTNVSTLDAQEILSGLPGIEITKIDKKNYKNDDMEIDNSCQDAQVSIIPSNGGEFDLEFDKDEDWLYDSVFKPRDVLEDDMDDEELELEAFKRFCQQSVPPKEKKVAHFNVADIVLKKKTDLKFS